MRAIPERLRDVSYTGAIQIDITFTLYLVVGWRFGVAVTRWSRSTQLLYIEPG